MTQEANNNNTFLKDNDNVLVQDKLYIQEPFNKPSEENRYEHQPETNQKKQEEPKHFMEMKDTKNHTYLNLKIENIENALKNYSIEDLIHGQERLHNYRKSFNIGTDLFYSKVYIIKTAVIRIENIKDELNLRINFQSGTSFYGIDVSKKNSIEIKEIIKKNLNDIGFENILLTNEETKSTELHNIDNIENKIQEDSTIVENKEKLNPQNSEKYKIHNQAFFTDNKNPQNQTKKNLNNSNQQPVPNSFTNHPPIHKSNKPK